MAGSRSSVNSALFGPQSAHARACAGSGSLQELYSEEHSPQTRKDIVNLIRFFQPQLLLKMILKSQLSAQPSKSLLDQTSPTDLL